MDEFLYQDKLLLIIGLFQFGLIFFMFMITNLNKRNGAIDDRSNQDSNQDLATRDIANIASGEAKPYLDTETLGQSNIDSPPKPTPQPTSSNLPQSNPEIAKIAPEAITDISSDRQPADLPNLAPLETSYSVNIDPELFTELMEISNNPAVTVDEAIRWWLRRRNLDSLDASIDSDDSDNDSHNLDRYLDRYLDRRYRVGTRSSSKRSLRDLWND